MSLLSPSKKNSSIEAKVVILGSQGTRVHLLGSNLMLLDFSLKLDEASNALWLDNSMTVSSYPPVSVCVRRSTSYRY